MLEEKIKSLPDSPGVYQYFDENGKLLYIGKAKSLKKRVKSYFRFTPALSPANNLSPRIYKMISQTKNLEYIVVESEHDALILENSLIKQLKPKYNILLRDDKTYPYIYVDLGEDFPRFEITRKVIEGKKIKYFGPFSSAAKEIIDSIYDLFPLVQKKGSLKNKKACLFYQIKKCLAPCENKISKEEYKEIVNAALEVIDNKPKLIKMLKKKMENYAKNLLFEEAATIRDRIEKIEKSSLHTSIDMAKREDYDVIAVEIEENRACVARIFIREGKVVSSSHNILKSDTGFNKDEIYKRAFLEYYRQEIPSFVNKILIYEDFEEREEIERLLRELFSKKVEILIPKRGEKRKITEITLKNAKEILKLEKNKNKESDKILKEIKELFYLENTPYTIEVFDTSHMQGSANVGAMIRWEGEFKKNLYRHYNLESKNEYDQMRELLQRRVESFDKLSPPDLWIIDGGAGQLNLAIQIIKQNRKSVDIIAIAKEKIDAKAHRAKGKAKDTLYSVNGILNLSDSDKRLQFIQKLRDEAHRFAISFHRKQKLKKDKEISLLKTKGLSEARIKKLLDYFETFENIKKASIEELSKIVPKNVAKEIKKE